MKISSKTMPIEWGQVIIAQGLNAQDGVES